jgi:hypothetical protein
MYISKGTNASDIQEFGTLPTTLTRPTDLVTAKDAGNVSQGKGLEWNVIKTVEMRRLRQTTRKHNSLFEKKNIGDRFQQLCRISKIQTR